MIKTLDQLIEALIVIREIRGGQTRVIRADSTGYESITAVNYENARDLTTGLETGVVIIGDLPS